MSNIADEFMEQWNLTAMVNGWIPCRKMTAARSNALRLRLKDADWRDNWREALQKAGPIPGLRGANDRGWKANVDWFLRPNTVVMILEGKYDAWKPRVSAPVIHGANATKERLARPANEATIDVVPNLAEAFKRPGVSPVKPVEG